jgi:hypothetical protein
LEGSDRRLIGHYPSIYLEGLRKIMRNLSESWCPRRDSNGALLNTSLEHYRKITLFGRNLCFLNTKDLRFIPMHHHHHQCYGLWTVEFSTSRRYRFEFIVVSICSDSVYRVVCYIFITKIRDI